MLRVENVSSLDLPELQPYLTLRRPRDHQEQGIFVAEGEKIVRRLLQSHFTVLSLLITPEWLEKLHPLLEKRPETIQVYLAEKKLVEHLTGFTFYQGLLAVGKIPEIFTLKRILEISPRPYLFVATDAISNAENMGVLVRNSTALGAQALIVGETSTSPYLRRAVRSSMGTIFKLPVVEVQNLVESLLELRHQGCSCFAAHPPAEEQRLSHADFSKNSCIVFGNEAYGISQPVLEACDAAVAIPMQAAVDSLNVGNASAVFLYEANRQRGKM